MADLSKGWVKLLRSIQQHELWQDKPFTKGQAWIDLILLANHQDNHKLIRNKNISIKQGQLLTSYLKLSKRWGWSRGKVRRFIHMLSTNSMIDIKTNTQMDTGFSLITLLNYKDLQQSFQQERTPKRTCNGHVTDTKTDTLNTVNNTISNGHLEIEKQYTNKNYKNDINSFTIQSNAIRKEKSDCKVFKTLTNQEKDQLLKYANWMTRPIHMTGQTESEVYDIFVRIAIKRGISVITQAVESEWNAYQPHPRKIWNKLKWEAL